MCISYLCFDSYHCCTAYHCIFCLCVFLFLYILKHFFCHCSVCLSDCLVLWASLPEIKVDDDDDKIHSMNSMIMYRTTTLTVSLCCKVFFCPFLRVVSAKRRDLHVLADVLARLDLLLEVAYIFRCYIGTVRLNHCPEPARRQVLE